MPRETGNDRSLETTQKQGPFARSSPLVHLADVADLTRSHRVTLSERHRIRAKTLELRAKADACSCGVSPCACATVRRTRSRREPVRRGDRWVQAIRRWQIDVPRAEALEAGAKWHAARASGQLVRLDSVRACGEGTLAYSCADCGHAHEVPLGCGVVRLCVRCEAKRAKRARARFAQSHAILMREAQRRGAFVRSRPGGAWGEKHLVLTVPHAPTRVFAAREDADHSPIVDRSASAEKRIEVLYRAWSYFARKLQAWGRAIARRRGGAAVAPLLAFSRWFEWTIGGGQHGLGDRAGHPHFHVWIFAPFLPIALVRAWWAEGLARCGILTFTEAGKASPDDLIVSLSAVRVRSVEIVRELAKGYAVTEKRLRILSAAGQDLAGYVEGWCVAALDPKTLEVAGSEVIAAVYRALEGRRLSQASRGFLGLAETLAASCHQCDGVRFGARTIDPWYRAAGKGVEGLRERTARELPAPAIPIAAIQRAAATRERLSPRELSERLELAAWDVRTGGGGFRRSYR